MRDGEITLEACAVGAQTHSELDSGFAVMTVKTGHCTV